MNCIFGFVVGAIQGGILGLLISLTLHNFNVFFPCDIIAACAFVCAVVGFIYGERVVDLLTDIIHNIIDFLPHGPN